MIVWGLDAYKWNILRITQNHDALISNEIIYLELEFLFFLEHYFQRETFSGVENQSRWTLFGGVPG